MDQILSRIQALFEGFGDNNNATLQMVRAIVGNDEEKLNRLIRLSLSLLEGRLGANPKHEISNDIDAYKKRLQAVEAKFISVGGNPNSGRFS
ncbi:hypothetical protein QQZ08_011581 [Neonectria magnoliae]|uniref:Uncharacterized protein n=1 Tax=Neonectria magnoliae TaxID=2732573 RepID=A0ABR1H8V6_9HYPO